MKMNGEEQKLALSAIKMMIGARANSQSAISADTVKAYLIAVSDSSLWAIEQATTAFIKGNVLEYDFNYYPPSAPRLAIEARKWDEANQLLLAGRERRAKERLVSYPIGTLPPPPLEPLGPIKLDIDGVPTDVSAWSNDQKNEAIRTGKIPDSVTSRIEGPDARAVDVRPRTMK